MNRKFMFVLSLVLVLSFVLAACATPTAAPATEAPATEAPTSAPAEKVTINWWHISTKDPALGDWQKMADDYMAAHPNVDIKITVLENEAYKSKLATVMQSGNPPDIFRSWGGGIVETDAFYDLCDEKGLMVYQEFPYCWGPPDFPLTDPAVLDDQVSRVV